MVQRIGRCEGKWFTLGSFYEEGFTPDRSLPNNGGQLQPPPHPPPLHQSQNDRSHDYHQKPRWFVMLWTISKPLLIASKTYLHPLNIHFLSGGVFHVTPACIFKQDYKPLSGWVYFMTLGIRVHFNWLIRRQRSQSAIRRKMQPFYIIIQGLQRTINLLLQCFITESIIGPTTQFKNQSPRHSYLPSPRKSGRLPSWFNLAVKDKEQAPLRLRNEFLDLTPNGLQL